MMKFSQPGKYIPTNDSKSARSTALITTRTPASPPPASPHAARFLMRSTSKTFENTEGLQSITRQPRASTSFSVAGHLSSSNRAARAEPGQACRVERNVVSLVPRTLRSTTVSSLPAATSGPYTAARALTDAPALVFASASSANAWRRATRSSMRESAIEAPDMRTSSSYLSVAASEGSPLVRSMRPFPDVVAGLAGGGGDAAVTAGHTRKTSSSFTVWPSKVKKGESLGTLNRPISTWRNLAFSSCKDMYRSAPKEGPCLEVPK
ncbi:unnamed protein product [Ectocarpus fasciculatus]